MDKVTLLMVDDEQPFLDTLGKRLEKRGLTIFKVYSGKDALAELTQNDSVEVVILDVKMPEMDGIETLMAIKQKFPLIEVIMLTGHATVESAIDGMKLGAFDYLMKPCDIDSLVEKVRDAAHKKRVHDEKIMQARLKEIMERRP